MPKMNSTKDQPSPSDIQPRYPKDYWDNADEYLRQCLILQHNADYLEFLVTRVWKLDQPCQAWSSLAAAPVRWAWSLCLY
jgi:hypothetical protein